MDLSRYFERISFRGDAKPDLATLRTLHRQHLLHIPYENLDIHLGRRMTTEGEAAYEKMVTAGRGGWCYEQNGLFGWALSEIGFDVTRAAAGTEGFLPEPGNHLVLLVSLDQTYVADVGLADGLFEPIPLQEHTTRQWFMDFGLEKLEDGRWRFHNYPTGGVKGFSFAAEAADEAVFRERSEWLQTAPESPFFHALLATRFTPTAIETLIGRVRKSITSEGVEGHLLRSGPELVAELRDTFGIETEGVEDLWPDVARRHDELFGDRDPFAT